MRRFIFAAHHKLAYGLKDTVNFLTNSSKDIYDINAYVNDEDDLENVVKDLFSSFEESDEVIVLTDIMGGSVYQKFYPYLCDNVHILCGMNLPLALSFILADETPFTKDRVAEIVEACKNQIVYVNLLNLTADEDDE